jgi:4'-phosphopantetheinyl transferase
MPLVHSEIIADACMLMVWELTETEETLQKKLPEHAKTEELLTISHPQKKREWMAGRMVISLLTERSGLVFRGLWKDEHGKPFLIDCPHFISLTHTQEYIGAAIHPYSPIGIDMEKKHEKLIRTAGKYLTDPERERAGNQVQDLCIMWCAKEAIFKLNGRKKVSFKDDILIHPLAAHSPRASGLLRENGNAINADLHIRWFGEYCLVVAV